MIRPGDPNPGHDDVAGAPVRLLTRLRDLTESARVRLDVGDAEDAFALIDEAGALLDDGRASIEAFVASRSRPPDTGIRGTGGTADEIHRALNEALEQHSRLVARLREAASGVADEIARMETTRRTMRAYGGLDMARTRSVPR